MYLETLPEYYRPPKQWTDEKVEKLRHMWLETKMSGTEIAKALGISRNIVVGKANRMWQAVRKPGENHRRPSWSQEREEQLKRLVLLGHSNRQIAKSMETTVCAVQYQVKRLRLNGKRPIPGHMVKGSTWTQWQVDQLVALLREGYSHSQIGIRIGKSKGAVEGKLYQLSLAEYRSQRTPARAVIVSAPNAHWKPLIDSKPVHITDLEFSHCPWPLWENYEAPTFFYCGQSKEEKIDERGKKIGEFHPYCACHRDISRRVA